MTMTAKIICDHIPILAPFGEFFSAPRTEKAAPSDVLKPAYAQGNA